MTSSASSKAPSTIVGVVPAAGRARRLGRQPSSKELILVGHRSGQAQPVSHFLLDGMARAGVENAFVVIAPGKWDIPESLRGGGEVGVNLAYMVREMPYGVPFTVDSAYPFIRNRNVAFGFPDIVFTPNDALARLTARIVVSSFDVVLGLFPVAHSSKWDAVVRSGDGSIADILPKPHDEFTKLTWILAVWKPSFTEFLHGFVSSFEPPTDGGTGEAGDVDVSMGVVFREALRSNILFEGVLMEDGSCLDIGTPEDLKRIRDMN